ncbi:Ppx/GppA phosphatase family protein [Amphiplicatus metriothermophilus]|uniref:Ppx/GppA phosphatase n=1 Tax=Amphiplicatus metriothermophilus TaxID=1519374 RepID=A0A239Q1U5_9PROT|nr:Ppx/GppA phosphatase family protein [Amphiplicatus metriothermophilus]MBB5519734.1 exopolyphosphatase/guanosine-5'-triphosphate,3'-diphosphate pyrophosphatase [Amphiplicatus metriothermophilus]SNT75927.1 Ppx/GppA phosphatase [Amphiplicatus metriothermophilus]
MVDSARRRRRRSRSRDGGGSAGAPKGAGRQGGGQAGKNAQGVNGTPAAESLSGAARPAPERLAALDLGTNNCRLLIAAPRGRKLRIIDAYSRIVRLGEGLSHTGVLAPAAMARTLDALKACAEKIEKRGVTRLRCIATQACRAAENGEAFLARVKEETGLAFEVISESEEARLAVRGCAELLDPGAQAGLVFDIGGGSTEISWIRPGRNGAGPETVAWVSLPVGVVSLSERWNGREIDARTYGAIVEEVRRMIAGFGDPGGLRGLFEQDAAHFVGTSGTVTSIAGVHLGLPRYRRDRVDGLWLSSEEARAVSERLRAMSFHARAGEPCIGLERADLVVCGCAILEALLQEWPARRIRVADRGLREGMLADLLDAATRARRRRKRARARRAAAK